eukprot:TRINITY_DN10063_c0_g1_i1.p1 TRINITY_DN10063_c0_g1~~TRINITY_DN10063_c0_g1_i1.p1  ORF type:complete len:633 (+),score=131.72 TRINITY_DN10063_c0_g1_i1:128-2026(+)
MASSASGQQAAPAAGYKAAPAAGYKAAPAAPKAPAPKAAVPKKPAAAAPPQKPESTAGSLLASFSAQASSVVSSATAQATSAVSSATAQVSALTAAEEDAPVTGPVALGKSAPKPQLPTANGVSAKAKGLTASGAASAPTFKKTAAKRGDESVTTREYLRFELVDFNCKALSKTVPYRHRDMSVYMYSGAISTGANQIVQVVPEEIGSVGCPNSKLLPDWSTEQILPWASRPEKGIVVKRVFCEQEGLKLLPRSLCVRLLAELKDLEGKNFELLIGGESAFVMGTKEERPLNSRYWRDCKMSGGAPEQQRWLPLFKGPEICTTLQNSKIVDFCYDVEQHMEAVGVDIVAMNSDYGAGQVDVAFAPKFGVQAADTAVTFRTGVKEMAQDGGLRATFMTNPFGVSGVGGSGHLSFSLWVPAATENGTTPSQASDVISQATAGRENAFHSSKDAEGLTPTARSFLAGILAHACALQAFCSPTPSCYCRQDSLAPSVANWGLDDRSACVRVRAARKGPQTGCYMELRLPSAAANPYLVIAGVVASGLHGLQQNLELPPARQQEAGGAAVLPKSLPEALAALEADEYLVSKLGARFVRWFGDVKCAEMKYIEEFLSKTEGTDEDITVARQNMYMEFV